MKAKFIILMLVAIFIHPISATASKDSCDLADTVALKAASGFKKDKAYGIKLYLKAIELCPDSTVVLYNLGIAYYIYGRPDLTIGYLQKAIKLDGTKPQWFSNLATVLLETNGSVKNAVKYAKKAIFLDGNSPAIVDTYTKAMTANGDLWHALNVINAARNQWSDNKRILKTYIDTRDQYISHCLKKIKSGEVEIGIAGLKKANFSVRATKVYLLALDNAGRSKEALQEATIAIGKFSGDISANGKISSILDGIMERMTRGFYLDFQAGNNARAVSSAKRLAEQYPSNQIAQKTYDDLLTALLADTSNIEVPAATAYVNNNVYDEASQVDSLIAGLDSNDPSKGTKIELKVDVDHNIPVGKLKRKYGVAVVIGNQRYASRGRGLPNVQYAERDAAVMKKYLVKTMGFSPENIIYKTNITSGDFRNIFGSSENQKGKLYNFIRPGESEVFIYYVGHGAPGPNGKTSYLVPVDAEADFIANNGYSLDLFYKILAKLPAKEITVVLDACFSGDSYAGPLFSKISPAMLKNVTPVRKVANSTIFAGADQNQVCAWYPAKRHSLFTYFFLKGLGGAADNNGDNIITANELGEFLGKEVPYWARREVNRSQNPLMMGSGDKVMVEF